MTPAERRRAEFVKGVASALRFLREVELGAELRAEDLGELRDQLDAGPAGLLLELLGRDLEAVRAAARRALDHLEGLRLAELAAAIEEPAAERAS